VTCREVEGLIIQYASGAAVPPEAAAHISGCEQCRRLANAIGEAPQAARPSSEQLKRIEAGILADLKPVKPLAPAAVFVCALIVILAAITAAGAAVLGTAGWRALDLAQRTVIFSALTAAAALLAFLAGRLIVPGSRLPLPPYLCVAAVWGVLSGVFAILFRPQKESTFVATGLVCLRIGLECAIPAGVLFWLLLRRGAVLNPVLTGVTTGALAGLGGLTVLEIFCPNPDAWHILVWHLAAAVASALGGLALGIIAEYSARRDVRRTS
jgi:hypothetical protein